MSNTTFFTTLMGLIGDEWVTIAKTVNLVILIGIVSLLGMITNAINIAVFVKMGLKDSITISFVALSISDFFSVASLFWGSFCHNPLIQRLETTTYYCDDVEYLSAGIPHIAFTRITGLITTYITAERCLCVALPLKVKKILTPRRTLIVVVIFYLIVLAAISPLYVVNSFGAKFFPHLNKTLLGTIQREDYVKWDNSIIGFLNIGLQNICFYGVILCTVVLVITLDRKTKLRKSMTAASSGGSNDEDEKFSSRDKKVSRMVVLISTIFIVCFLPTVLGEAVIMTVPGFNLIGRYRNSFLVFITATFLIEAVNASINSFVYYNMSANYRTMLMNMMPSCMKREAT